MSALPRYLVERFHPALTVPLAALLAAALAGPATVSPAGWGRATVYVWLLLLLARGVDDLTSLADDRRTHPHRGLVAGRIDPRALGGWLTPAFALALLIGQPAVTLGGCALLGLAFLSRSRVRPGLWPLASNGVYLLAGVWIAGAPGLGTTATPALAVALWLGGAAHHFLHERDAAARRGSAGVTGAGLALAAACTVACLVAFRTAPGAAAWAGALALATLTATIILALGGWRRGGCRVSGFFYTWGYLMFLLPIGAWSALAFVERLGADGT